MKKIEIYPPNSKRKISLFFEILKNREHMGMLAIKYASRVSSLPIKYSCLFEYKNVFPQHLVVKLSVSFSVCDSEHILPPNSVLDRLGSEFLSTLDKNADNSLFQIIPDI